MTYKTRATLRPPGCFRGMCVVQLQAMCTLYIELLLFATAWAQLSSASLARALMSLARAVLLCSCRSPTDTFGQRRASCTR
jgi:hypothetical protein